MCCDIAIDNNIIDRVTEKAVRTVGFNKFFYEPNYLFDVGMEVNSMIILEQLSIKRNFGEKYCSEKSYKVKCVKDGYETIMSEQKLKDGYCCPVCSNKIVVRGLNDLATTHPDVVKYLANKEDAYLYSYGSHKKILVVCPICKSKKKVSVMWLAKHRCVFCDMCNDNISYPNKFAHELFEQLSSQIQEYIPEYSPEWAGKKRYDNYIRLLDSTEIAVEMDGGLHYNECFDVDFELLMNRDKEKDAMALEHGITVVRINCHYDQVCNRYEHIKNNVMSSLKKYFDLSCVDWGACDKAGTSNLLVEIVSYYNKHRYMFPGQIAEHFNVSKSSVVNYLHIGDELGLCEYIPIGGSLPVVMCDMNNNLIGIFKSAKCIEEEFPEEGFKANSIQACIKRGSEQYKGYVFKYATHKEYYSYLEEQSHKDIA